MDHSPPQQQQQQGEQGDQRQDHHQDHHQDHRKDQFQASPHSQPLPSSPRLQPRAHRSTSPVSSSSSSSSSQPLPVTTTILTPDGTLSQSHSPPASSSGSSSSSIASRSSRKDATAAGSRADLTASIISNLTLDDGGGSSSSTHAEEEQQHKDPDDEGLNFAAVSQERVERIPLIREDTSTRRAIEQTMSLAKDVGQHPSPYTNTSAAASDDRDFPRHPMFGRLEPPASASVRSGAPSSEAMSSSLSAERFSIPLLSPEESEPHDRERYRHPHHHSRRQQQHHHHHHHHHHHGQNVEEEERTASDPHQPQTTFGQSNLQTVPTVSSTGMPRLFHRHADDPTLQSQYGSQGAPPKELLPEGPQRSRRRSSLRSSPSSSSSSASTFSHEGSTSSYSSSRGPTPAPAATSSLLLIALSPSSPITWQRRIAILTSSLFVNLGLPFINGVCLGFGEIFARTLIAPLVLGIVNSRWPHIAGSGGKNNSMGTDAKYGFDLNTGRTREQRDEVRWETGSGRGGIGTAGVGVRAASTY